MIRIKLPYHLQTLAGTDAEVSIPSPESPTVLEVIRALEATYPTLRGVVIDNTTGKRRAKVRLFACKQDISHQEMSELLPQPVINGEEPLLIVGAISGR